MSLPLFENLTVIASRLLTAPQWLLCLDYDGTLTPLVGDPSQALLAPTTRELLESLAQHTKITTAIVSGRALRDLQTLVGIERLFYAGNHGLDIFGPGFRFIDAVALGKQEILAQLAHELILRLEGIPGAAVEYKKLTITVHYRLVAPVWVAEVHRHVDEILTRSGHCLHRTYGKMVIEIRPTAAWHKGKAIGWIRERTCVLQSLSLYIGDDQTDEDAFQSLRGEITIKVGGDPQATLAHYHVENPSRVEEFLVWLGEQVIAGER